ncbi:MAG TPA: sigma-70 family RNA polymerase sigma factor [Planctomycetota bacterium]|nr:sigma-70 family RNA polymerase sigma factor [Planctomycetota bacterium]
MTDFPSSIWTTLLTIRKDPGRVRDLVVRRYRQPVYDFIRRQGLPHEDAEDITQDVFTQICRDGFLERVDPKKGKFRTLVLAVTRHLIASFHRRELAGIRDRRRIVALEEFDVAAVHPDDGDFDDLWVKNLVDLSMLRLKDDPGISALRLQLEGRSYQEISATLKKSATDVTNYIHRAKKKLRAEIEFLIREYCGAEEVEEEVASLLRYLQ